MSDIQRDREERQHVIEVLKSWDGYFIGYTSDEVQEALRYAIASIETDLRYDLLYEGVDCNNCKNNWHRGDGSTYCATGDGICHYEYEEPTTKNDVPDINVGKIEPTPKNNLGVDAVRRKAVLNTLDNMDSALEDEDRTVETYKELLKECYKVLPSVTVTPQEPIIDFEELKRKILMEVDGGTDDAWLAYGEVCNRISNSIDEFVADMRGEEV